MRAKTCAIGCGLALLMMAATAGGAAARPGGGSGERRPPVVLRYDGPIHYTDAGQAMVLSPDGRTAYVTGFSFVSLRDNDDITTIAYDTATGRRRWTTTWNSTVAGQDVGDEMALSPDGRTLYVVGGTVFSLGRDGIHTFAYDTATGSLLWQRRYEGSARAFDFPSGIVVSPDGRAVYVAGDVEDTGSGDDYVVLAYRSDGAPLWTDRFDGGHHGGQDTPNGIGIDPRGARVYVTGLSSVNAVAHDYVTIADDARTGARDWLARYDDAAHGDDIAQALAVAHDGRRVYVTGYAGGGGGLFDDVTVAYDAGSGTQAAVGRYDGPDHLGDTAVALQVSPDDRRVYVAGGSITSNHLSDFATVAYAAPNLHQVWAARYDGPDGLDDAATKLAVSPSGDLLYVTGERQGASTRYDIETLGYAAASGTLLGSTTYDGPGHMDDVPHAIAVSPSGSVVYVSGESWGDGTDDD